jgi:hypothetical protein
MFWGPIGTEPSAAGPLLMDNRSRHPLRRKLVRERIGIMLVPPCTQSNDTLGLLDSWTYTDGFPSADEYKNDPRNPALKAAPAEKH